MRSLNKKGEPSTVGQSGSFSITLTTCAWCGKSLSWANYDSMISCYPWGYFDCMECFIKYKENEEKIKLKKEEQDE
jgi:hypothetical protein